MGDKALQTISLVGQGIGAFGQYQGSQNAADVYEYNAQVAKYRSQYAQDRSKVELARLSRSVESHISRKRAIAGKSGTVTDSGSNVDVRERVRDEAEIDASIIRYNADIESWAAENEADRLNTQADQIRGAGYVGVGSTLLNAGSRYDWKKGPFATKRPTIAERKFGVGPGV